MEIKKEAGLFNSFFADQYSVIKNSREFSSTFSNSTKNLISSFTFSGDIVKKSQNLDPNKFQGYDYHNMQSIYLETTSNEIQTTY